MSDSEMAKCIITWKEKEKLEGPKKDELNVVNNDMRKAGVRKWRLQAKDGVGWQSIVAKTR
jgi:hypothetical protein